MNKNVITIYGVEHGGTLLEDAVAKGFTYQAKGIPQRILELLLNIFSPKLG